MAFNLPQLPYSFNALEPHIDAKTMEIHHGKHHQAYVINLNKALESAPNLATKSAEDVIKDLAATPCAPAAADTSITVPVGSCSLQQRVRTSRLVNWPRRSTRLLEAWMNSK